jgi:uncharacterized protein
MIDTFELYELDILEYFHRDVYVEIIDDNAFKRLNDIKLLGALDYLFVYKGVPLSNSQSRYQHSLGVAMLALYYSKLCKLCLEDEQLIVTAALLHDIGHPPLSHSLEPEFNRRFGLDHHSVGEMIIRGNAPIATKINSILINHNISIDEVIALIEGTSKSKHTFLFNSKFNIDTIDGILRAYNYLTGKPTALNRYYVFDQVTGKRLTLKKLKIMDDFWNLKNKVYKKYIFGDENCFADLIAQNYMKMHIAQFKFEDYFLKETELKECHPALFEQINNSLKHVKATHKRKFYYVDKTIIIKEMSSVPMRYKNAIYKHDVKENKNEVIQDNIV